MSDNTSGVHVFETPTAKGQKIEFTEEQAQRIQAADELSAQGVTLLQQWSTSQAQFLPPPEMEQVALMNGISGLLIDKGILTLQEVFVAKRESRAEQIGGIVVQAQAYLEQQRKKVVVAGPGDMPQGPNRAQRRSNGRPRR
jgi:hypothetical protein